jgi:membrane protease YdiL (CAAX protease family)
VSAHSPIGLPNGNQDGVPSRPLLTLFLGGLAGEVAVGALAPAGLSLRRSEHPTAYLAITTLGLALVAVWLLVASSEALSRRGLTLAAIGLGHVDVPREVARGLRAYVATLPLLVGSLIAVSWLSSHMQWGPQKGGLQEVAQQATRSWLAAALFLLMTSVAAPVLEEVLFRGLLFTALRQRMSFAPAAAASALAFALLHDPLAWAPIAILGFVFAGLYERTHSLVPSMAAHAVHNALFFALMAVTGAWNS